MSAKGNRFAFVEISDPTGSFEVTVFSEELESAGEYLSVGKNVIVRVNAKTENDQIRMQAGRIEPLNPPTVKPKTWLKVVLQRQCGAIVDCGTSQAGKTGGRAPMPGVPFCFARYLMKLTSMMLKSRFRALLNSTRDFGKQLSVCRVCRKCWKDNNMR